MPTTGALDLSPYLPRLTLGWMAETPDRTFQDVEGTVAFVDISGFTKLSERLARRGKVGAEELTEAIGNCFRELLSVAYVNGGSLIKFGGDALLLLFTGQDHVERAVGSAAGMRGLLRKVGRFDSPAGRVLLRMSVGVHTGRFNFFLVGNLHRELLITGPAATQTVLMEQAAIAGEIVVSAPTAAQLPPRMVGAAKGEGFLLRAAQNAPAIDTYTSRPHDEASPMALPIEVREHLLGGGCEPEHRLATVTFIRFEGVDDVIEREGSASLAGRLSTLVQTVQDVAAEQGVTFLSTDVDRDGGKIILVAGAPRSTGTDEEASLVAARKVIESEPPLPIKIGVNRGHVFAGDIGPSYRRTYTVMGDTVNLAARLMAAAEPGRILAPESVLERSRTRFGTTALPPFTVKGKARPVHAFEIGPMISEGTDGSSTENLPIIGRDLELAELRAALDGARAGLGRVVQLTGAPGMGLSRVAEAIGHGATDMDVFWTRGGPYVASSPYFPFRALLRDLLGAQKGEPPEATGRRLLERVSADAPDLVAWLPLIGIVMDLSIGSTPETEALGEEFRRQQLERVMTDFFSVLLPGPALLVFEDIHYFDEASGRLIVALATAAPEYPWLILTTRREGAEAVALPPHAQTIVLGPLTSADTRALAESATEEAPMHEHELATIVERSGGNPLVLRELLAATAAAGSIEGLPDSLEALMTARIDQLPPRDRTLLRNASVLGTVFDESMLEAVLDGHVPGRGDPVWSRISQYVAADPSGYRFANPLIRDAAYEGLTFRARRVLHARVGDRIIQSSESPEDNAELLALHFFFAGRYAETWRFARLAGESAKAKYANIEAARFFLQALESGKRLEGVPVEDLAVVQEALGDALNAAAEFKKAEHAYRSARHLRRGNAVADARLLLKEAQIADRLGRLSVGLLRLSRGRKLLEGLDDPEAASTRAQLSMWYAAVRRMQGHYRDAINWCHRTIEEAEAAGDRKALAYAHQVLDWALESIGEEEDRIHLKIALEIYEELGDMKGQAVVLNNLGTGAYFEGRWDDAVDLYERGRLAHERIGDPVGAATGIFNIGEILSDQGRLDEAEPLLRRALRTARAAGERDTVGYVLSQLGRVAARRGRYDEALTTYEQAKALFTEVGDSPAVIETGVRIAECLVLMGDPSSALALVEELIGRDRTLATVSPLTPLVLRTRGQCLMQLGDLPAARAALEASLDAATTRRADYEIALTLRAMSLLNEREGKPDPEMIGRSVEILSRLGVIETADPPEAAIGDGSALAP